MTEEMHLLGEPEDHPELANLPPKERARTQRLRNWLAEPAWHPAQAMAVLCGYDPEVGRNTCAADMAFLPGADDFYGVTADARSPDDLRALDAGVEEQFGYISGLRLTTMPPEEAIAKTIAAGVPIPWIKVARDDPWCRKYLPLEALGASADARRVPLTASEVASLGGIARRERDPKRAKWFPLVEERLADGGKPAEILAELEQEDDAPARSTLYRWCQDIKERKANK
jgi:hypothetical protein